MLKKINKDIFKDLKKVNFGKQNDLLLLDFVFSWFKKLLIAKKIFKIFWTWNAHHFSDFARFFIGFDKMMLHKKTNKLPEIYRDTE